MAGWRFWTSNASSRSSPTRPNTTRPAPRPAAAKRDSPGGRGVGSTEGMGICHAYAPDGRCISLLKILLTNCCIFDCAYCVNRVSSNTCRARGSRVDEVVDLTLAFYQRNYIEGLFLSSGIIRSADYTMEQMVEVARTLREDHDFRGYIHLKTDPRGVARRWSPRPGSTPTGCRSTSSCRPTRAWRALAPEKDAGAASRRRDGRGSRLRRRRPRRRRAQGQARRSSRPPARSTQMIVGADAASDARDPHAQRSTLYGAYRLRRVYYSAFSRSRTPAPRLPLARAAADARAPALPGRLADALLRLRARRDRSAGDGRHARRSTSIPSSPGR